MTGTTRFDPHDCGWPVGTSRQPKGEPVWILASRTTGVIGAQGSGKSLDLLFQALLGHRGAALSTLTKLQDLALTLQHRARTGPVVVLDPFNMAPGAPELVWDLLDGCVSATVAERRAKAFAAGTVSGAVATGTEDGAARYYAAETVKVLKAMLHAAALTGRDLDDVLAWISQPRKHADKIEEILSTHPMAEPYWDGQFHGALFNEDERTSGNTISTIQQAMSTFFDSNYRARCTPSDARPATDIAQLIRDNGTLYLLGREDPYSAASPLMTAVAEHVLDVARDLATRSPHSKLCPPFLALLDELPSTAPLPSLLTSMANDRDLGICYIWAAQDERQLKMVYGTDAAESLLGLTNNLIGFGGGKNMDFYRRLSELLGGRTVTRTTRSSGPGGSGTSHSSDWEPVLRPEEIRRLPQRQALLIAENARGIILDLARCVEGPAGKKLLAERETVLSEISQRRGQTTNAKQLAEQALAHAHVHGLSKQTGGTP
ncbi:MAG: Type secretory pathway VirD4 component-like [Frankiales bacterium]|nr:Type secretory pathway VirD4 component-like [Frankiales bacterium]